jgi:uncharacterized protein (TIRG00374 family)
MGIKYEDLLIGIRAAEPRWLVLAILSTLAGLGLKLWRWGFLLNNLRVPWNFSRLFSAYFVGQATNILLPFRGGELVRLGYFSEDSKKLPQVASSIIVEKYLDVIALTMFTLVVSYKISLDNLLNARRFLLPLSILATGVFILLIIFGPSLWKRVKQFQRLPDQLVNVVDGLVQSGEWLKNPWKVMPAIVLTILIWGMMWSTNLLLFNSLGLSPSGPAGALVLVLVYLGLLPALMPGNIGPFYFFARLALLPFGVVEGQAVVFAVLLHAIVTIPPLSGGGFGLLLPRSQAVRE